MIATSRATDSAWWRDDGREIHFVSGNGRSVLACDVRTAPTFVIGKPRVLFEVAEDNLGLAPAPHGDRFLLLQPVGAEPSSLVVVQNWAAQLDKQD